MDKLIKDIDNILSKEVCEEASSSNDFIVGFFHAKNKIIEALKGNNKNELYIEPKLNNRYVVEFPSELGLEPYLVQRITNPKYYDCSWENIIIEFIDTIPISVSKILYGLIDYNTKTKNEKINFNIKIKITDPIGDVIETWLIEVAEIVAIDFGTMTYSDNHVLKPSLTIKPFNCILN